MINFYIAIINWIGFRRASLWGWWSGTTTWWSTSGTRGSTPGLACTPSGPPSSSAPHTSTSSKSLDRGIFFFLRQCQVEMFALITTSEYGGSQELRPMASAAFSTTLRLFLIYPWTLDLGCWFTLGPELPSSWKAVQRLAPMWTHMLAHSDRHQNCLYHHTSLQNLLRPLRETLPKLSKVFHIF